MPITDFLEHNARMHPGEAALTEITPQNQEVFAPQKMTVEGNTVKLPPAAVAAMEIELE